MMSIKMQKISVILLSFLLCAGVTKIAKAQEVHVSNLRVEYLQHPLGIDMPHPRFSWILKGDRRGIQQEGYQIVVASNTKKLNSDQAGIWNSGQVSSGKSTNIAYDGKSLKSDQTYYWKVRVQGKNGRWSNWSKTASFHTGLMKQSDWQGEWIGAADTTISAPQLRKEFDIHKKVKSAHVFISGLGYYELYLNGQKVGNHELDPGTTDFNKRALYVTYNVKKYLNSGDNAIGVWLGNGYFRMKSNQQFKDYGNRPQLMFQMNITYTDGTTAHIVSNTSWKVSASPIIKNNVYNGEVYDARKEHKGWSEPYFGQRKSNLIPVGTAKYRHNNKEWSNAVRVNVPKSRKLSAQLMPPIRVVKTIYPINMWEPLPGIYVYDFGQNLTGWPQLFVNGGEGDKVIMKTAETTRRGMLRMKGENTAGIVDTIDARPNRTAKARDIYILAGKPGTEVYHPRFTYHGFRYVQLEGYPGKPNLSTVSVQIVHTDVKKVGTFESSNALINRIHQNILWGQRSNLMSMPTDCPQRDERMGWMADADLSAEEAMHNFDMAAFYTNWINLIQDEQNKNGSVPDIVPDHKWLPGTKVGTPAWQVAYPLMVWYMHKYYGDDRVIKKHYKSLKKWMNYMASIANNYIITTGRGDWVPPERGGAPVDGSIPLTSTGYYYKSADLMAKMAGVLGKNQDKTKYVSLADSIKNAFQQKFWNDVTQTYGNGSQTSNAFPLYVGIVADSLQQTVLHDLVHNIRYKHNNHLWVGILGTKALVEVLPKLGKSNVLYSMVNEKTYPGWGYMISKGATTLWERWGGYKYFGPAMNSLNHIMFGSIDEFFYKYLAGIQMAAPGFKKIRIQPEIQQGLDHAAASMKTIRGKVASSWKREGDTIEMNVMIPPNSTARISIPKAGLSGPFIVKESGKTVWENHKFQQVRGIKSADENSDYITFEAGSGNYNFELSGKK
jgi:alpha-L-rhamnosidase